jgi:hypothetical protein
LVERAALQQSFASRQSELLTLQGEVSQLRRVRAGLEQDEAFLRAVARHELHAPSRAIAIPVEAPLRHDPRTRPPEPVDVHYEEPSYLPILTALVESPGRRLRWSLMAAALLLFGFACLHEEAGSRAIGGALRAAAGAAWRRYRRTDRPETGSG